MKIDENIIKASESAVDVPTDIIQSNPRFLSGFQDSIQGGLTIETANNDRGTGGMVVFNGFRGMGQPMLLTCHHVLAVSGKLVPGSIVPAPAAKSSIPTGSTYRAGRPWSV